MISRSTEATIELAKKFAKKLKGGEVIGLVGELGSGKTTFVKGLAQGVGIRELITSPTFVIIKEYQIPKNSIHPVFVHVDAYRVKSIEDLISAGIEDYLGRDDMIMVIEWAEKIKEVLPKNTLYIKFEVLTKNRREIIYDFRH